MREALLDSIAEAQAEEKSTELLKQSMTEANSRHQVKAPNSRFGRTCSQYSEKRSVSQARVAQLSRRAATMAVELFDVSGVPIRISV